MSFETSYDFTWGLASSSDRPTQLWMILSFYLLFACVGQEQHSLNSNRMIFLTQESKSLCLCVLLGAASALPLTLIELVETSAEKVPDEKRWWIKKWMKDATWRLWNCENIDSCRVPAGHLLADGSHEREVILPMTHMIQQTAYNRNQHVKQSVSDIYYKSHIWDLFGMSWKIKA